MQTIIDFQKQIRQALNHLYNPEQLRQSPLIAWFDLSERYDGPSALQRALMEAIEALRPGQYEPALSEARKTYEILLMRYIQQFSQPEVAHHLGVSERQFRREQNRAIDILADSIWKKFAKNLKPGMVPADRVGSADRGVPADHIDPADHVDPADRIDPADQPAPADLWNIEAEWGWIKNSHSERVTGTDAFIHGILELIRSVAAQYQVQLIFSATERLPDVAMHPVALRQILLNLLRVAIACAGGGQVTMEVTRQEALLELRVAAHPAEGRAATPLFDPGENLLKIAAHLTELSRGQFSLAEPGSGFRARLLLPVVEGVSVLVVDDSPEIIHLLQRYTTGTRYHVTGLEDPEQVFEAIESSGARLIILDVMMPKIDGWELLGRLRQHPLTQNIPVVILSILAQEELALSLGARALVVKPVTQQKFLSVLDQIFVTLN